MSSEILTLTDDPQLEGELQTACAALGESQPLLRFASDHRELWDAIRSRPPSLVLAPFGDDPREVLQLARELDSADGPPIPVAAVFRPEGFGEDVSESAVLIDAMRAGVRDFLRRPISTTEVRMLLENAARDAAPTERPTTASLGRVITFISNKGGVGKSTLAVNTAVGLARRHPERVLLIDASLQMGVAATLLDLQPGSTLSDAALERDRLDETMLRQLAVSHPCGLHLVAAPVDAVAAMEVDDTAIAQVITLARRQYDFVVVDTFPMFDRVVIAILDLTDRAYVVVENVVPTLLGAVKLVEVLDRIGFPSERQRVVVNRYQRIGGSLALDDIATRLGRTIEHVLPYDKRVIAAANSGDPIGLQSFRWGGFARELDRLVQNINGLASPESAAAESRNGHGAASLDPAALEADTPEIGHGREF